MEGPAAAGPLRAVSRFTWRRPRLVTLGQVSAPVAAFLLVYVAALIALLIQSLWTSDAFTGKVIHSWTLDNFREIADPPYVRGGGKNCPRSRRCRSSDANFSDSNGPRSVTIGRIARTTGLNSLTIDSANPTFTITAEGVANVGATADKVGRTTGWTRGTVSNTCVNTGVSGSTIVLLCQTFVTASGVIVQGGDSGSPVFATGSGNNVTLLGGLWGGNQSGTQFVYSPIANIRSELGDLITH